MHGSMFDPKYPLRLKNNPYPGVTGDKSHNSPCPIFYWTSDWLDLDCGFKRDAAKGTERGAGSTASQNRRMGEFWIWAFRLGIADLNKDSARAKESAKGENKQKTVGIGIATD